MCIIKTALFEIVPDNIKGKSYPKSYKRNNISQKSDKRMTVSSQTKKRHVHLSSEMGLV